MSVKILWSPTIPRSPHTHTQQINTTDIHMRLQGSKMIESV